MPDTLPVHINRQERHSLEVPPSFETSDSFVIAVTNHGEAGRIHIHLDDGLPEVASIDETNYYVEANATKEIPVSVHSATHVFGKIKLVSGYGAVTRWVDVELTEPANDQVQVDEDLARPQPDDERETQTQRPSAGLGDNPALPVVGMAVLALVVALAAAAFFQSPIVAGGAVLVVGAVLVASYLLLQ